MSSRFNILIDFILLSVIVFLSFFLSAFLLSGEVLQTGYQDWMVHAYRVKLLDAYGYSSWIHNWSNGVSPWQSYQFIPHLITLMLVKLSGLTITKSMIVITIFLFSFTRVSIYIVLRSLKFSPLVSFISTLLSFSIATFWAGAKDYSLMFGHSLFPVFLFLWIKYYNGKLSYFYPFLVGLVFYIHPILGMSLGALMVIGNLFSSKKVIGKKSFIEYTIFLVGSSLFWLPIIVSREYTFVNLYFSTRDFIAQMLRGFNFLGFSIPIVISAVLSIFAMKFTKKTRWSIPLFIYSLLISSITVLNSFFELPRIINITQFSRSSVIVNISLLFLGAFFTKRVLKSKILVLKLVLVAVSTYSIVIGIESSIINSPKVLTDIPDPVKVALERNLIDTSKGRIWSPVIGTSSYYSDSSAFFPVSYNEHLDSNPMGMRIGQFFIYTNQQKNLTKSSINQINNYLNITGTKYVILSSGNQLTRSFADENAANISKSTLIKDEEIYYELFEMNWNAKNALFINEKTVLSNQFEIENDTNEEIRKNKLDDLVLNLTRSLDYSSDNTLNVTYPTNDQLEINLGNSTKSKYIFINESYDPNWKAYIGDLQQKIHQFGPNLMVIETNTIGRNLILKHTWPIYHYVSIFLILFLLVAIPLLSLAWNLSKKKIVKREEKILLHEIN